MPKRFPVQGRSYLPRRCVCQSIEPATIQLAESVVPARPSSGAQASSVASTLLPRPPPCPSTGLHNRKRELMQSSARVVVYAFNSSSLREREDLSNQPLLPTALRAAADRQGVGRARSRCD